MNAIVGRKPEQEVLKEAIKNDQSELINNIINVDSLFKD
jgi:hypothetical protein